MSTNWLNRLDNAIETTEHSTPERILEAARTVFLREGYSGARMQQIADEAGINKAMLHYYYRSKDDLFHRVLGEALAAFIPRVQAIFSGEGTVMEKLERYLEEHLSLLLKNPGLPLFVISESHRDPKAFVDRFFGNTPGESPFRPILEQMRSEMQSGILRQHEPTHVWMHVLSMTVFPFAARPMLKRITGTDDPKFQMMLEQRKSHILQFVRMALMPTQHP